jgi:hypothetical protein
MTLFYAWNWLREAEREMVTPGPLAELIIDHLV